MAGRPRRRALRRRNNPNVYDLAREIARYALTHSVTGASLRSKFPALDASGADVVARNAEHLKREYGSRLRSDEWLAGEAEDKINRLVLGEIN